MANAYDGGAAQNSAHHRAAIDLIHLGRSLEIELGARAYREQDRRARPRAHLIRQAALALLHRDMMLLLAKAD